MTYSISYSQSDELLDPWNVCLYVFKNEFEIKEKWQMIVVRSDHRVV
jgi:hypothetical protein